LLKELRSPFRHLIVEMSNMELTRRQFLKALGCATVSAHFGQVSALNAPQAKRPNLVLIMADDVSPDMFGCYGNRQVKTPNIDSLARQGVQFKTCWATPMCSPTRAALMTGRYGFRNGIFHNSVATRDGREYHLHNLTFPRMLKEAGYRTAVSGKWNTAGKAWLKESGFDEFCLWTGLRDLPKGARYDGLMENSETTSRYWHPCFVANHELVPTKSGDFGPDICIDFLVDFIKRNRSQPFMAYYSMMLPHGTREGRTTTPISGKFDDLNSGSLEENVEYVDVLVGRLSEAIKKLGLAENTILFFTSDNGTAITAKTNATERGAHVPLVVWGEGHIKQRGKTDALTDLTDIFPTFADYANVRIPDDYELDGKSLVRFLGGDSEGHREWIFSYIGSARMLRDARWLLEAVDEREGLPEGRFYDCGTSRKGYGYENVSESRDPQVIAARKRFVRILDNLPALDEDATGMKEALAKYDKTRKHRLQNRPEYQ
jgi:arylsulfatase A-like enzyme